MKAMTCHISLHRMLKAGIPLLLVMLFFGCSPSHVLHHKTEGNQSFTYIDFQRNHTPFELAEVIAENHTRSIKIMGFAGNKILVEFVPQNENILFNISGYGFDVIRCKKEIKTILVRKRETIVSITIAALSKGEYTLKLTRL